MGLEQDMTRDGWSPSAAVEQKSPVPFRELLQTLLDKRSALVREADKGVAPDAFKKIQALLGAFDAAAGGLEKARERHFAKK